MICSICAEDKEPDLFPKTPSGHRSYCKECYRVKRNEARKEPHARSVHNAASRRWAANNRPKRAEICKAWSSRNAEQVRETKRRYCENNKGKVNAHTAMRRARKSKATPPWINRAEVVAIYKLAKERGLFVDHIVPIHNELVCGLHCEDNLRCITKELNEFKGNRYWPDMPRTLVPPKGSKSK
jgi:hypothetical protein